MSLNNLKLVFTILYALGLVLLFSLSYWQYSRGIEKQKISELRSQIKDKVLMAAPSSWNDYFYKDVSIQGQWLHENAFLLENRIKEGQVGFEVLTPFRLKDDQTIILINRGWVANTEDADQKPTSGAAVLQGTIYQPEKGVVLGDAILPEELASKKFPKRSLYIDLPVFSNSLKIPIQPVLFVLDESNKASYPRIWKAVVMTAHKHFGYAIQWLGLALTFMVYGFIWFRRRS